jgi:hypothetical protein
MWDGNRLGFNILKVDFARCAQIKNYIIQFKQLIKNNRELNFIIYYTLNSKISSRIILAQRVIRKVSDIFDIRSLN